MGASINLCYCHSTANFVKDEKGDLLAIPTVFSTGQKNHFSQLFNTNVVYEEI
jgi:hypothetical protein